MIHLRPGNNFGESTLDANAPEAHAVDPASPQESSALGAAWVAGTARNPDGRLDHQGMPVAATLTVGERPAERPLGIVTRLLRVPFTRGDVREAPDEWRQVSPGAHGSFVLAPGMPKGDQQPGPSPQANTWRVPPSPWDTNFVVQGGGPPPGAR